MMRSKLELHYVSHTDVNNFNSLKENICVCNKVCLYIRLGLSRNQIGTVY